MIKKISNFFATKKRQSLLIHGWLFFLCFLCYGILIPTLGFYWDDLPILFSYKTSGAAGFLEFLASDRPFSAWNFMLTTSLFKFNPLGYHILAFLLRFLSAILFYHILKILWPDKTKTTAIAATIFAVYPGFLQQPIAVIYCHHLSVFCLYLLSVLLMLKNARNERFNWLLGVISWFATLHMFSIENFATLEMIKPVLLWIVLKPKYKVVKPTLMAVVKQWLPYLLIFLAFMVWRVFIFKFPTYEPDLLESYQSSPGFTLTNLFLRIPKDFFTVTIGAWLNTFKLPTVSQFGLLATCLFWVLVIVTSIISFVFLMQISPEKADQKGKKKSLIEMLCVGLLLFFLSASIIWVLALPLEIEFAWDRMTLAFIPAVAILAGTFFTMSNKFKTIGNIVICLLLSAAIGSHFENEMSYKRDWENMQNLFWQMTWRMPDLEKDTTVITSEIGLNYYSDNSLTAPLNLTYDPENKSSSLNYLFYYSDVRVGSWLSALEKDIDIRQPYRSFLFKGSTNQTIAIKYDPPACLQVMDRIYANSISLPNLSVMQVEELKLTDLGLIRTSSTHIPLPEIFGSQPEPNWCYYFEKADLARQNSQYDEVVALGEEALNKGFSPRAASEWLPFLESNIFLENWEEVENIADQIQAAEGNYLDGLCVTIKRLSKNDQVVNPEKLSQYLRDYNCP